MPGFERFAKRPAPKSTEQGDAPSTNETNPVNERRSISFAEGTKEPSKDGLETNKPVQSVPPFAANAGFGGGLNNQMGSSGGFGFGPSSFGSFQSSTATVSFRGTNYYKSTIMEMSHRVLPNENLRVPWISSFAEFIRRRLWRW